jgi:diadenosine tetraphosphate (Ap4A) HIT family hydrolase
MPHLISREQALLELQKNKSGNCFLCSLINGNAKFILEKNNSVTVFLSEYPRFWGQIMIAPNIHSEKFFELDENTWKEMNHFALKSARILEKLFSPVRCYIASTGSPENLPMTCPHNHINVIPVYDATLKPAQVFTWANGLYAGSEVEWKELFSLLSKEWK